MTGDRLWVFGYGSLMTEPWEDRFDGTRHPGAVLPGFRRAFNKKSTENWGTPEQPCPTLGLEPAPSLDCVGHAFEFPPPTAAAAWTFVRTREGPSFALVPSAVRVPGVGTVEAITAVNDPAADSYVGDLDLSRRAAMVAGAEGEYGSCREYVARIREELDRMGVRDMAVEAFYALVCSSDAGPD